MLVEKTQIMDQKAMSRAITRISFEIIERNKGAGNLCIVGIVTRGAQLAQRVAKRIYELENSQVEQDKKASEIDMAILGLMDTILTMQTQP